MSEDLVRDEPPSAETLVAWDRVGGWRRQSYCLERRARSRSPFRPEIKPVDAYAAAILDELNVDEHSCGNMLE